MHTGVRVRRGDEGSMHTSFDETRWECSDKEVDTESWYLIAVLPYLLLAVSVQ